VLSKSIFAAARVLTELNERHKQKAYTKESKLTFLLTKVDADLELRLWMECIRQKTPYFRVKAMPLVNSARAHHCWNGCQPLVEFENFGIMHSF
jgi:hypothetical protein